MSDISQLMTKAIFLVAAMSPLGVLAQSANATSRSESAIALIEKARATYQALENYQLERTTTIFESQADAKPKQVAELQFNTATTGGEKLREDVPIPPLNLRRCRLGVGTGGHQSVLVSGDDVQWWYSSRDNVYKKGKSEGLGVLGSVGGPLLLSIHFFPLMTLEKGTIDDARIIREESLKVDKQERRCYVIEGYAQPFDLAAQAAKAAAALEAGKPVELPPQPKFLGMEFFLAMLHTQGHLGDSNRLSFYMSKGKPTKLTLWIDKSDYLLVKSEMTATLGKSTISKDKPAESIQEELNVTLVDSFTRLKINEELPKELFQFTPPAEAKEFQQEKAAPRAEPPAAATSDGEAAALIDKGRKAYSKLRSYQFDRTTTFLEERNGKEPKKIAKLDFTAASDGAKPLSEDSLVLPLNPNRFLLSVKNGENKYILVSNDDEGWWFGPEAKIHKTGKGILTAGSGPGSALLKVHIFPFALLEDGVVQKARIVGEETIEIEGEKRLCKVIEGRMKATYLEEFGAKIPAAIISAALRGEVPVPPEGPRILGIDGLQIVLNAQRITDVAFGYGAKAMETKVTLWVDQSQHLLVRSALSSTLRKYWVSKEKPFEQQEEEVQVTLTDSFTRLKINE